MKATAPLFVCSAVFLVALVGDRPADGEEPSVLLNGSRGALIAKSDRQGEAVVRGANMAPGQKVNGTVRVTVNRQAKLGLRIDKVKRRPGLHGRGLGRWLRLKVKRVGRGPGPRHVYGGPVIGFRRLGLGRWEAGASHGYRVKLKLRANAASQNYLQDARTRFRLVWRASE